MHGINTVGVRRVNQHRADGQEIAEKLSHVQTRAWIGGHTRHRIEIVIERDQRGAGEMCGTLRTHRRRVAPDLQFETIAQRRNGLVKRRNALVVIFEDEDGFHSSLMFDRSLFQRSKFELSRRRCFSD